MEENKGSACCIVARHPKGTNKSERNSSQNSRGKVNSSGSCDAAPIVNETSEERMEYSSCKERTAYHTNEDTAKSGDQSTSEIITERSSDKAYQVGEEDRR